MRIETRQRKIVWKEIIGSSDDCTMLVHLAHFADLIIKLALTLVCNLLIKQPIFTE